MAALLFSKHGVIFAIPISPLAKWVKPFFISPHFLASNSCCPLYAVLIKDMGTNDASTASSISLRGLIAAISASIDHSHPSGSSNGLSSLLISGKALGFLILPSLTSSTFSAAMRSSSTEAGSSLGSCGTNLPRTANSRISSRSFLMPVSSSLLLLPRPALLLGRTAVVQRSRWSVIRFSIAIMPAPLAWPHLCPRRHPEWLLAGHAGSGFQPALWHSAPAARRGHGLSAHRHGGF
ncbi:hypothetical protein D3C72_1140310 [compost metagenome]